MADGSSEDAWLDRVSTGFHRIEGLEDAPTDRPELLQTTHNANWVRERFAADKPMWRDYLQALATYPQLRHTDTPTIVGHVEGVVSHFAGDGLTRRDYLKAVAADPRLLLQKAATVIANIEAVMSHYAADRLMRRDYTARGINLRVLM